MLHQKFSEFLGKTVNLPTFPILYPALRSLLVNRLQKGLNLEEILDFDRTQKLASKFNLNALTGHSLPVEPHVFPEIPLNQISAGTQIEYVSAVAFKFSQNQSLPTLALAEQIVANLRARAQLVPVNTPIEQIWQNLMIRVVEPGWIHLSLTDAGLAEWLQWAITWNWQHVDLVNVAKDTPVQPFLDPYSVHSFEILHTYARCCSLLRLAGQEDWIQLDWNNLSASLSKVAIPWLDANQSFRARHQQALSLTWQLSEAIDYLADSHLAAARGFVTPPEIQRALKVAHRLSQSFQSFHAACQIWGTGQQEQPLVQVRLGLVLLICLVLKTLIESRLQLTAYPEL